MYDNRLILDKTKSLWLEHFPQGSVVFLTGATGFFGKCLLESFLYINEQLKLNGTIIALSRNSAKFLIEYPKFKNESIHFIDGSITDFDFPASNINFIIHAAHDFSEDSFLQPLEERTDIRGAKRILELSFAKKVKSLLFTSSGAVYYNQVETQREFTEDDYDCKVYKHSHNQYTDNKRYIEKMFCDFASTHLDIEIKIARCFAFVGRYLPLDNGYAIGNFIKNILNKETIVIKSDGSARRSYLYAADMCVWLWHILLTGKNCHPYNVGSNVVFSVGEIADEIARIGNVKVNFEYDKNKNYNSWYIPSIERAKSELGVGIYTNFEEAVLHTIDFFSKKN
jgi:nucleoside-diphosphate-sugar epimerase